MRKVGVIGVGNMGEALIKGLLYKRILAPQDIIGSHPRAQRRRQLSRALGIKMVAKNHEVASNANVVIIAVKPQTLNTVLDEICHVDGEEDSLGIRQRHSVAQANGRVGRGSKSQGKPLFVSIVAGVKLDYLERRLGRGTRVIRVMPNAPAVVNKGMAAVVRGTYATKADEAFVVRLFNAVGKAVAMRDESSLDAVTAVSGSGPAYIALFLQALARAGSREGLPPTLAQTLAYHTASGTLAMLEELRLTPEKLIRLVASPGGTTEAALSKFSQLGFQEIVAEAVRAAALRSKELGSIR